MEKDGKTPKFELMRNGVKLDDLTKGQLIDFIQQATSSLRY
jgi:hypothetical protein